MNQMKVSGRLRSFTAIILFLGIILLPSTFLFSEEPETFDFQENFYKVTLPEDIGTIEHLWKGSSDKTFILIQDSHISLEVQLHIADIIKTLINDYGVTLVNIEGADQEKIDFKELRELEPKDVVERVSLEFLKECRINGAVYAKINSKTDFAQYGTEDKDMYLANYKFYLAVKENNSTLLKYVTDVKNELLKKKDRFISKDLKELINLELLFKDNDTTLVAYFKVLIKYATQTNIDLLKYKTITQLMDLAQKDPSGKSFEQLDNAEMLDELSELGDHVKEALATTPKEKKFVDLLAKLFTVQNLLELKILPEDFEDFKANMSDYSQEALSELVHVFFPENNTDPLYELKKIIVNINHFYQKADDRSGIIFRNSLENMEAEGVTTSVIVSGGFHTDGIAKLCEDNDVSYLRIMPVATSTEETVDYEKRMLDLKDELLGEVAKKTDQQPTDE